jgi:hypothetical protein
MDRGLINLVITPTAAGFGVLLALNKSDGRPFNPSLNSSNHAPIVPFRGDVHIIAHHFFPSSSYPLSTHLIQEIQHTIETHLHEGNQLGWRDMLGSIITTCGPGSFTSLRTTIAALQGLAIGAQVPFYSYTRKDLYQHHCTKNATACLMVIHQNRPTMLGYEIFPDPFLSSSSPLVLPWDAIKCHAHERGLVMVGDVPVTSSSLDVSCFNGTFHHEERDEALLLLGLHHESMVQSTQPQENHSEIFYGTKAYYEA